MNYLIKMIKEAQVVDGNPVPATYEFTLLVDAIAEDGKAVKVKGQRIILTKQQVEQKINQLEQELGGWKSVMADIG